MQAEVVVRGGLWPAVCSAALRVALLCPSNTRAALLCPAVLLGQNGRLHHSPVDSRLTMTMTRGCECHWPYETNICLAIAAVQLKHILHR